MNCWQNCRYHSFQVLLAQRQVPITLGTAGKTVGTSHSRYYQQNSRYYSIKVLHKGKYRSPLEVPAKLQVPFTRGTADNSVCTTHFSFCWQTVHVGTTHSSNCLQNCSTSHSRYYWQNCRYLSIQVRTVQVPITLGTAGKTVGTSHSRYYQQNSRYYSLKVLHKGKYCSPQEVPAKLQVPLTRGTADNSVGTTHFSFSWQTVHVGTTHSSNCMQNCSTAHSRYYWQNCRYLSIQVRTVQVPITLGTAGKTVGTSHSRYYQQNSRYYSVKLLHKGKYRSPYRKCRQNCRYHLPQELLTKLQVTLNSGNVGRLQVSLTQGTACQTVGTTHSTAGKI